MSGNSNDINNIKSNNFNNYIILHVKISEKILNKDIKLLNQEKANKNDYNFQKTDIETIYDNQIGNIKFKDDEYYWNFTKTGIHTIKIIFKKKLLQCNKLFYCCNNIYKIDCSNFDCSQIIDCSSMFYQCSSLININLGKLDFALSNDFSYMFYNCNNLEKLNVSYFNTNNSKSFSNMFYKCSKLKKINLSKFKTSKCENISFMFYNCSSLESIDMINWDMKNINDIDYLFKGCSKLKNIKMNFNNDKKLSFYGTFSALPESGSFVGKKETNYIEILKYLANGWDVIQE